MLSRRRQAANQTQLFATPRLRVKEPLLKPLQRRRQPERCEDEGFVDFSRNADHFVA